MKSYTDCKTVNTGLYKPHTIYLDNIGISVVYFSKDCITNKKLIAIAIDTANNSYYIYETKTAYGNIGYLAFPMFPDKIKGFYPYL